MKNNIFSGTKTKLCIAAVIGVFVSDFLENGFWLPTVVMIIGIDLIVATIEKNR